MTSTARILQLDNYVSPRRIQDQNIHSLNLDGCLKQPYTINPISNNENIGTISLAGNYLIQIPSFVSDYTNLLELNVSHNELHNTEFLLYRSSDLNTSSRPLTHPFLQNINLSFNHIKSLPSNLHYLRFLHTLDLSSNYLNELPNDIGYLEQLHTLLLNDNHLKTLPRTFSRLLQLEHLDLSANQFQSIDTMKNFLKLKSFAINSNPLNIFPMLLNTCVNIEEISCSEIHLHRMNEISLEYFQQFVKLKKLNLSKNHLTNQFLVSSNQPFEQLEELHLNSNQLTTIFALLSTMKSLHLLDLSFNSLIHLPECFNPQLQILRLSYNNIEIDGNDCAYLKHICELDLNHNQIKRIPPEFLQCTHLRLLNLSSNEFETFPEILFQLRSLNQLIFNFAEVQSLSSYELFKKYLHRTLNVLDLARNQLHTNLYPLTVLKALTYLDLSENQLSELHQNFRGMTCLKVLKLSGNKFSIFPLCLYQMSNKRNDKYLSK